MTETQKKTFNLEFTQDFGSISYSVRVEAETVEEAVSKYHDNMELYDPTWVKKAVETASSVGIDADGLPVYEGEEDDYYEDDED
jgi:methenyltetrahydromethanopterin cyclohydrolase